MHPCLCIPEILTTIFEEVNRNDLRKARPDLHVLVATCKTFSGPAIAILWRTLFNPVPLLLAMPIDLWELKVVPQDVSGTFQRKLLTFKRDVTPEDWRMFDFYAQFVKELETANIGRKSLIPYFTIDERIVGELKLRNCVLLPNLKTAKVVASHYSALFLAPLTQHLTLHMHPNNVADICRLIEDIPLRSPHLKSLRLKQSFEWQPVTIRILAAALPQLLNSLQDLENFFCDWLTLSDEMAIALLRMANLRKITVYKEIPALDRLLLDHKVESPYLEEVMIWVDDLGVHSLAGLLTSLRPALLTSFHVLTFIGSCFQADLDGFLNTISKHCSPARFAELVLNSPHITTPTNAIVTAANFSTLGPLLSFSQLRVLTLSQHPFDLTDEEIKQIAIAWPNLTKLEYEVMGTIPEPRMTMRGLLWLATFCRELESLTFNFHRVCEIFPDELALAANHGLTFLDVGESTIDNPKEMATFLKVVFPRLAGVRSRSDF